MAFMSAPHKALLSILLLVAALILARVDFSRVAGTLHDMFDVKTYEWFMGDCRTPVDLSAEIDESVNVAGKVHVVYIADANEFQDLLSSMLSLSRHADAPGECEIHVIVHPAEMEQAARLVECFKTELDELMTVPAVKLHQLQPITLNLSSFKEVWREVWPTGARALKPLTFAQLYLQEYLPLAPRAIWLDTDTIVRSDVGRLYRMPMKSAMAAALDVKWVTWRTAYEQLLDAVDSSLLRAIPDLGARTLNAGVLVFDLERWRSDDLTSKLEAWVTRAWGVKAVQLALNLEFLNGAFDVLDWRWNVMGLMMVPPRRCIEEARILHWEGPIKPWTGEDISLRLKNLYRELAGPFAPVRECRWNDTVSMLDTDVDI